MLLPSNQPIRNIASLTHFLSWSFPVIIQRYVLPCACKTIFCKVKGNSCIRNNTHWLKMNKKEESEKKNMKNTSGMNLLMLFIVLTAFVVLSKLQRKLISYCHVINNCNIVIIQNLLSFCNICTSMPSSRKAECLIFCRTCWCTLTKCVIVQAHTLSTLCHLIFVSFCTLLFIITDVVWHSICNICFIYSL